MLVYPWKNGVILDTGLTKIAVDVPKPVPGAVHIVTHAHADHTGAVRRVPAVATPGTHEILRELGYKTAEPLREGAIRVFGGTEISLIPAGHIPGSAQVVVNNGRTIIITGDWKLEPDILEPGAEVPESPDVLILETTFSAPQYQFPPRKETYERMRKWVLANLGIGNHVVLFGYATGKSQELTALLNSWGIDPIVPERTHRINQLFGLSDILIGSKSWQRVFEEPSVFVLPPKFSDVLPGLEAELKRPVVARSCSGWARNGFQLSSHGDFKQSLEFVERSSPRTVLTYGGNAIQFAAVLRRMGYDAAPLTRSILI